MKYYLSSQQFDFNSEKSYQFLHERGISFTDIVDTISKNGILLDIAHPNQDEYSNKKMFIIEYDDYIYCVPYVIDNKRKKLFLKTIYPSRKYKKFLKPEDTNEKEI